jgi:hypothetical protein
MDEDDLVDRTTGARITIHTASSHIHRFCHSIQFMDLNESDALTDMNGSFSESHLVPSDESKEESVPLFYFRKNIRSGNFLCVVELPPRLHVYIYIFSPSICLSIPHSTRKSRQHYQKWTDLPLFSGDSMRRGGDV